MGIIGWIVLGLIAGAIAKAIMPGDDPGGIFLTMLLGVVGALLGGFLGSAIFGVGLSEFWSIQTWLIAIIGSVIVLAIYRAIAGRRAVSR
ncbi:MAG: GlsB/YeaQ/YmgE family stress response membrane protein [Actinobacteria bacterium]|nr:GlsB/YeaQ/YmgE family stress response membrane protein [Actinomycetota bacterium]